MPEQTIVLVDDDPVQLASIRALLEQDGFRVEAFTDAAHVLERCTHEAPALVISDVMMPEIGGFELHARYLRQFPDRGTPFVFLSSLSDAHSITRGLDAGADDYLQKPIEPSVLKAKVRSILRRRRRAPQTSFRGNLKTHPLSSVLRLCETQGLTGYVDFFAGDTLLSLRFRAGEMDDTAAEETLTRLSDLVEAPFIVHSSPIDFAELEGVRRSAPADSENPLGRVSSVRLNAKTLQVQTEVVGDDPRFVVSVVLIDARTVWKHSERVPPNAPPSTVVDLIDRLHDEIEEKLNTHMAEELLRRAGTATSIREQFHSLFDEGFDRFREHDYSGAIDRWQRAMEIEPSNAALALNIKIARDKAKAGVG